MPLRFAGSKARCLEPLDAHFSSLGLRPGHFAYFEPMCGSLAVGLHVMAKYRPAEAVVADASPDIVNFFQHVRREHAALAARIRELEGAGLDAATYYDLRRRFNEKRDAPLEAAAQFYLLNRACYNGVYRVNAAGHFNVPFGRFRGSGVCTVSPAMWDSLHRAHAVLKAVNVRFVCLDVEDFMTRHCVNRPPGPALVYCDPPYIGTDRCLYQPRDQFTLAKHVRMERALAAWASRGAHVAVNQSNVAAARDVYRDWRVEEMHGDRRVGCKVGSRGAGVFEILLVKPAGACP